MSQSNARPTFMPPPVRWCLGVAVAVVLAGCGTSSSKSGLTFPVSQVGLGYPSQAGMGGRLDPAETAAINPFDPIALNNLAVTEASRGRYQQAVSLLQRAVRLAPARADIAENLMSMQRWLAQAEGQAALGMQPQPLQLPYQESGVPEVPALWSRPAPAPSALPPSPARGLGGPSMPLKGR